MFCFSFPDCTMHMPNRSSETYAILINLAMGELTSAQIKNRLQILVPAGIYPGWSPRHGPQPRGFAVWDLP